VNHPDLTQTELETLLNLGLVWVIGIGPLSVSGPIYGNGSVRWTTSQDILVAVRSSRTASVRLLG
jgi:hypothetical protein